MHLVHLLLFCYTHILLHFAAGACLRFVIYHRASEICPVNRCIVTLTNYVILTSQMCCSTLQNHIPCRNFLNSVCYRWNTRRWMVRWYKGL